MPTSGSIPRRRNEPVSERDRGNRKARRARRRISLGRSRGGRKSNPLVVSERCRRAGALAQVLGHGFASAMADHTPQSISLEWHAKGDLCPIMAGCLLSDCAEKLLEGGITMPDVAVPVLVLPFAARAAYRLNACIEIDGQDWCAVTDGTVLSLAGTVPSQAARLSVRVGGLLGVVQPKCTRARPNAADLAALDRFARRTYAPATEQSRLLGAGAGLSDND